MPAPSVAPTGWFIPTGQPTAFRRQSFGRSIDRKSTRLNSSHSQISYAVFCLKKKKKNHIILTSETNSHDEVRLSATLTSTSNSLPAYTCLRIQYSNTHPSTLQFLTQLAAKHT